MKEPKRIVSPIKNSDLQFHPVGVIAERCKVIQGAFQLHRISFKDMEYALMQYLRMEVEAKDERIRIDRHIPDKPYKPAKNSPEKLFAKYYRELETRRRAISLNYEASAQISRVEEYQLALKDDEYDFKVAKEWALYILNGETIGAVAEYLGMSTYHKLPKPELDVEY